MRKRIHWKTRQKQEREAAADQQRLRGTSFPAGPQAPLINDDDDFSAFIDGVRALNKVTKTGWLTSTRSMLSLIDRQNES